MNQPPPPEKPEPGNRAWLRWSGHLARLTLGSLAVAIAAAVLVAAALRTPPPRRAWVEERLTRPVPRAAPAPESHTAEREAPAPPPDPADMLAEIQFGIVRIESRSPGGSLNVGAGCVLAPEGWVATNFHVLSSATRARVFFADGGSHEIAGYRAVSPENDLAVVELAGRPLRLAPLSLQLEPPRPLEPVFAIGHPQGMSFSPFNGMVSRVVSTAQLPPRSRQFVRLSLAEAGDLTWIQHTARLSEGNSGGPLVNSRGEVLGLNTWTDRDTQFSFALHARHVRELLERPFPRAAPLAQFARQQERIETAAALLSPGRIAALLESAELFGWRPTDLAQYDQLSELAWAIVAVHTVDGLRRIPGEAEQRRAALAADRVLARLREKEWGSSRQRAAVNRFARERLRRPATGIFFFGRVEQLFQGGAGERALLVQMEGTEELLLLPVDAQLSFPEPGSACLVLGIGYEGEVARFGENPLQPREARRVVTAPNTIIPLAPAEE